MSDPNPDPTGEPEDNLAALRGKADRTDKAERENALLRAKVDLDTSIGKMFARAYDGPLDADAIKAAYAEVAPAAVAPAAPAPTGEQPGLSPEQLADQDREQRQHDDARRGVSSIPPDPNPDPNSGRDPVDVGFEEFRSRINAGEPMEKAAPAVTHALIVDGIEGGERAWNGWSQDQLEGNAPIVPSRPPVLHD